MLLSLLIICFFTFKIFGYQHYVVVSDSMAPTIKKYSLVYVKKITDENTDVQIGDIIAIKTSSRPLLHRVVENTDGRIITKGDANQTSDQPIGHGDVIGVMKFSIPLVGILFLSVYPWILLGLGIMMFFVVRQLIREFKGR